MVRLDAESKACLAAAAELRRISVSDYIRIVTLRSARREVDSAREQTIRLSPDEQVAFWSALRQPPKLTAAQRSSQRSCGAMRDQRKIHAGDRAGGFR